jgi:AhpD family alkylhydroperoxidase
MSRKEIYAQIKQAFGFVPGFWDGASDAVLEQWWTLFTWLETDTALSSRDKVLIAFGAAAATHCEYCVPFHTGQLALRGMGEDEIKDASWAALSVTGLSTYLYGIGYSHEQFAEELAKIGEYVAKSAQK